MNLIENKQEELSRSEKYIILDALRDFNVKLEADVQICRRFPNLIKIYNDKIEQIKTITKKLRNTL